VARDTLDVATEGPTRWRVQARLLTRFSPASVRLDAQGHATALVDGHWYPVEDDGRVRIPIWDQPKGQYRN
jgi:hypothetical protein